MATNPMQKKVRNYFLLGVLVTLVVTGGLIAYLFLGLSNYKKEEKARKGNMVSAYALIQDVKSGQIITQDMLKLITVDKTLVPSNATSNPGFIRNYSLEDKEGNKITTVKEEDKKTGEIKTTLRLNKKNNKYEILQEENGNYYYKEKDRDEKIFIELNEVPLVAKVAMKKNTLITPELLNRGTNDLRDDVRKQEYNVVVLPMDISTGDYVDIRIMLPNGQDFIIVSKKEVEIANINGSDSVSTFYMNLTEDEILYMSCAIVDAASLKGSKIYATKYTEAGRQEAAMPTYPINEAISTLIKSDPNILDKAKKELEDRIDATKAAHMRNNYVNNLYQPDPESKIEEGKQKLEDSAKKSISERKEYLESLANPVE